MMDSQSDETGISDTLDFFFFFFFFLLLNHAEELFQEFLQNSLCGYLNFLRKQKK